MTASDDVMLYGRRLHRLQEWWPCQRLPTGGALDDFEPEHLTAFEAGGKSQWLNGRLALNAAAFYYDFDDLQVRTITLEGGPQGVDVANAAKSRALEGS